MYHLLVSTSTFLLPLLSLAQETDMVKQYQTTVEAPPSVVPLVEASDIVPKVEVMPKFPGGTKALAQFLGQNIRYPQDAIDNDVEGRLMVKFVVCEDGTLCNEVFENHLGSGCEQEVLRVLRSMPPWEPGLVDGKPVKTYFRLPVTFKFEEPDEEVAEPK